jgi:hypothetical protein
MNSLNTNSSGGVKIIIPMVMHVRERAEMGKNAVYRCLFEFLLSCHKAKTWSPLFDVNGWRVFCETLLSFNDSLESLKMLNQLQRSKSGRKESTRMMHKTC